MIHTWSDDHISKKLAVTDIYIYIYMCVCVCVCVLTITNMEHHNISIRAIQLECSNKKFLFNLELKDNFEGVVFIIFTNPSAQAGYDTRSFFF